MRKIYKYLLSLKPQHEVGKLITLRMPVEREYLSIGVQNGEIVLWAVVNTESKKVDVDFRTFWTGDNAPLGKYQGTVTIEELVYHVYGG